MSADCDRLTSIDASFFLNHQQKTFKEDQQSNQSSFNYRSTFTDNELNESIKLDIKEDSKRNQSTNSEVKYPPHKFFIFRYQIGFYTKNDFIYEFTGDLNEKIFLQSTLKLRNYPMHLKATLFPPDKDTSIRKQEFTFIEIHFNELKEKGNKMYKKGKFKESLDFYIEAYGLFNWLELKDKSSYTTIVKNQKPILDNDIIECSNLHNIPNDSDSYSSDDYMITILLAMSYSFMELHHYKNAIECLNECLTYNDTNPDALFRKSQARFYNKNSSEVELNLALLDIQKAITSVSKTNCNIPSIFTEHLNLLNRYINEKKKFEMDQIQKFISEAISTFGKCYDRSLWVNFSKKCRIQEIQWNVLKVMKRKYQTVIKYYNETHNNEQFLLACNEIEGFMGKYKSFKYFHTLNIEMILNKINHDIKGYKNYLVKDVSFLNFLEFFKNRTADLVFQNGKFNIELIKYAIGKVNQEIKSKEYLESESYSSQQEKWNKKKERISKSLSLPFSIGLLIMSILFIFVHYFLFLTNPPHRIKNIK